MGLPPGLGGQDRAHALRVAAVSILMLPWSAAAVSVLLPARGPRTRPVHVDTVDSRQPGLKHPAKP